MTPEDQMASTAAGRAESCLVEIAAAIAATPDPELEPIPRRRTELVARVQTLGSLHSRLLNLSRHQVRRAADRVARLETQGRQVRAMIRDFEARAEELSSPQPGRAEIRQVEEAACYQAALVYARDSRGPAEHGAITAWGRAHGVDWAAAGFEPLPALEARLVEERAARDRLQAEVDAIVRAWAADGRPPAA